MRQKTPRRFVRTPVVATNQQHDRISRAAQDLDRFRRVLTVVLCVLLFRPAAAQPAANVRVAPAVMQRLMVPRAVTGEIISLRHSMLASQVEGFVVAVSVEAGDTVAEGDIVARLDDTLARLDVDSAAADLLAARGVVDQRRAELTRFKNDYERVESLQREGSTTQSELDAALADVRTTGALLAQAEARVSSAEAALARARRRLADKAIAAPFAGRVVRKSTEVGEWVTPGVTIAEIVSLTEVEARIDVPEHLVSFLTTDVGTISLRIPGLGADTDAGATVIGVIPQADRLSRMFPVRLAVSADGGVLMPGMSLTAFVPTGSFAPVLTVPKDAIRRDDAGEFVYLAVPDHDERNPAVTAQAMPVRIVRRFAAGDLVAIEAGRIHPGSFVLVEGNERVFPTQKLIVQNPPPGSPFAPGGAPPTQSGGGGEPGAAGAAGGPDGSGGHG